MIETIVVKKQYIFKYFRYIIILFLYMAALVKTCHINIGECDYFGVKTVAKYYYMKFST